MWIAARGTWSARDVLITPPRPGIRMAVPRAMGLAAHAGRPGLPALSRGLTGPCRLGGKDAIGLLPGADWGHRGA